MQRPACLGQWVYIALWPLLPQIISTQCIRKFKQNYPQQFPPGLPASPLVLLQLISHTVARMILLKCKSHCVTTLFIPLQWPSTALQIKPKSLQRHTKPYRIFLLLPLTSLMSSPTTSPSFLTLGHPQWPLVSHAKYVSTWAFALVGFQKGESLPAVNPLIFIYKEAMTI